MMRKLLFSVLAVLLFSWGYSQGFETFDNFPETGTAYVDGTFIGDEGFEWTYTQSRGDTELDGKALMLGRNRSPDAQLESADISGGIGTLQFSYMQAFSSNVDMEVYVNDVLVYTATTSSQQNEEMQSDLITVEEEGDFVLKFYNPNGAGQVLIDNIEWTAFGGETDGYCIPGGTNANYYLDSFVTTGGTHNIDNSGSGYSPGGYGDFYDEYYVSQVQTGTVEFTAQGYDTFGFRIWIDWNQDGVFDPTEEVAWNSTSYSATQSGTITVPMDAAVGDTRMRVVYHWLNSTGNIDPCATDHSYGEFEDYKFVVEELSACSGMPTVGDAEVSPDAGNPGSEYTVSVDTYGLDAGLEFQWQSNTNGDGWENEGSAEDEYSDFTATAPDNYGDTVEWRLALTCTHTGDTAYSTTATFTVEMTYCTPTYTSTIDYLSMIESVGADVDITYSATEQPENGYADETDQILQTVAGAVFDINTTYVGGANGVKIWIDWDNDGEFDPDDVMAYEANADLEKTLEIEIPSDAADGTYRMRVRAQYGSSADPEPCGSTSWGSAVDFTVEVLGGDPIDYCIPEGVNSTYYINDFVTSDANVNISNINSGFSPGGYGDFFDTMTVSQVQGEDVSFEANFMPSSSTFGFRIWVDWNQDGIFDPDTEVVYHSTSYENSHSGTFTVPVDALPGTTRMRIVNHWLNSQGDIDPCTVGFTYGEFEDYKFVVGEMDDCEGIPEGGTAVVTPESGNPGSTYEVSAHSYTYGNGLNYQWQSNTDGAGWENEGDATEFYEGLTATAPSELGVEVEWRLEVSCTLSDETSYSEIATYTTVITYCIPSISTVEPITRVVFAGIDNPSSASSTDPYEDFTDIEGNVETGEEYSIALEGNTNGSYTNYFTVWVDWNQNGVFDADEMYEIGSIEGSTGEDGQQATGEITVPADAVEGSTRMRVIKNYNTSPTDPCGTYTWGQAEDYTLVVGEGNGEPGGEECWQGIPSVATVPNAYGITIGTQFRIAEDFTVPEGTTFTVEQLTFDINNIEVPDFAIINLRADNGGEPGEVLYTIEMEPSSWEEVGTAFGEPIYNMVFDLADPIEFGEGLYWIDPKMSVPSGDTVWWASTDEDSDGALPMASGDDGATWGSSIDTHMVFTISGHCATLGLGEVSNFDFAYYPNPVRDVLYINSAKNIENVRVFNLTGQEIISNSKASNGQINVNSLPAGVYIFRVMLEGGQLETFKIIKK